MNNVSFYKCKKYVSNNIYNESQITIFLIFFKTSYYI